MDPSRGSSTHVEEHGVDKTLRSESDVPKRMGSVVDQARHSREREQMPTGKYIATLAFAFIMTAMMLGMIMTMKGY